MRVKDLIAELQKQDPDSEVGIGCEHTHYVQKVGHVLLEERPACVPDGCPVVVVFMAETIYVPADEA